MQTQSARELLAQPLGVAAATLALPLLGLAAATAHLWLIWLSHEHYGYGWIVPVFVAYSYWLRWQGRPAPGSSCVAAGALSLAGGLLLFGAGRWLHEAGADWRPPYLAMTVGGAAIAFGGLLWQGGWRWARHFAFPALFPLAAVPWPMGFELDLSQGLSRANAAVAAEALAWSGSPAARVGNVLLTPGGAVGIEDACSGIRSMQAVLMLGLLFGEYFRLTPVRRVVLATAAVGLALGLNLVRTLVLVSLSARIGAGGLDRWHDPVANGFFVLSCAAIWLAGLALRSRAAAPAGRENALHPPRRNISSAGDGVHSRSIIPKAIVVAAVMAIVVAELFPVGWFARGDSLRADDGVRLSVRVPEDLSGAVELPLGRLVHRTLQADSTLAMTWQRDGEPWLLYHFVWEPGNVHALPARSHTPEICLTGRSGMRLAARHPPVLVEAGTARMEFDFYTFEQDGTPWHVFFASWQETRGGTAAPAVRRVPTGVERVHAAVTGQRVQGLATLELATRGSVDPAQAERAFRREVGRWLVSGSPAALHENGMRDGGIAVEKSRRLPLNAL